MSVAIETGTISDTVLRFASGFIGDFDYYYLYDSVDSNTDNEEYTLILSQNFDSENNEFVAPVKYIKIYQHNLTSEPFSPRTYSYSVATFQTNSVVPSNNGYIVYSNIGDDYSRLVERGLNHEQAVLGYVVLPVLLIACIVFVLLQQIFRHDG